MRKWIDPREPRTPGNGRGLDLQDGAERARKAGKLRESPRSEGRALRIWFASDTVLLETLPGKLTFGGWRLIWELDAMEPNAPCFAVALAAVRVKLNFVRREQANQRLCRPLPQIKVSRI